jgi:hypothetical protein
MTETEILHLLVDFNGLDGTAIPVGAVDSWRLAGLPLADGVTAIFEQPGELQMTGVLRQISSAVGPYWIGEVDPTSLVYHVRLDAGTLAAAGPETRYATLARDGATGDWRPHPRPPAALTLGVEGAFESWARALLNETDGTAIVDGQGLVLVDARDAVDARAQVLRLSPDAEFPEGRRVWLATPDWTTLRRIPWDHPAHQETPPVQTLLSWTPVPSDRYDAPGYQAETAALPGEYGRGTTREAALADLDARIAQALAQRRSLEASPAQPSATASAALLAERMRAAGAADGAASLAGLGQQAYATVTDEALQALADARLVALLRASSAVLLDSAEVIARCRRSFLQGWRSLGS